MTDGTGSSLSPMLSELRSNYSSRAAILIIFINVQFCRFSTPDHDLDILNFDSTRRGRDGELESNIEPSPYRWQRVVAQDTSLYPLPLAFAALRDPWFRYVHHSFQMITIQMPGPLFFSSLYIQALNKLGISHINDCVSRPFVCFDEARSDLAWPIAVVWFGVSRRIVHRVLTKADGFDSDKRSKFYMSYSRSSDSQSFLFRTGKNYHPTH